jgi:hypothetical protein
LGKLVNTPRVDAEFKEKNGANFKRTIMRLLTNAYLDADNKLLKWDKSMTYKHMLTCSHGTNYLSKFPNQFLCAIKKLTFQQGNCTSVTLFFFAFFIFATSCVTTT